MPELRREVGFVNAIGKSRVASLIWPEGVGAAIVGIGGASLLLEYTDLEARLRTASDALVVLSPLLGVILAALTLVIAVSSNEYVNLLKKTSGGVVAFYRPFIIAIGLEIWTILLVIAYRATAQEVSQDAEGWMFRIVGFLVAFCLLDVLAVARSVLMHAMSRARMVEP
jgi:hypothetical protein